MKSLSELLTGSELQFFGSACSDFQAHPIRKNEIGIPIISSDWEHMIFQNLNGNKKIKGKQNPDEFPRLRAKFISYVKRSKELGENMFRISLDPARLSPRIDEFDEKLMNEYILQLAIIKYFGLVPMLTLYHWPMPLTLCETNDRGTVNKGGWEHKDALTWFAAFIEKATEALINKTRITRILRNVGFDEAFIFKILVEGLVKFIITINEPSTFTMNGYLAKLFPPYQFARFGKWNKVLKTLSTAHKIAYEVCHKRMKGVQAGVAYNWTYFDGPLGWAAQRYVNERITKMFEEDGTYSDFLGFQYYNRVSLPMPYPPIGKIKPSNRYYGDHPGFGDMYPRGMYWSLKKLHSMFPNKRIIVTEFGVVDNSDIKRPYIIMETVRQALLAKEEGIPLFGMLIWSLVDNFEWERGMNCRLGMFAENDLEKLLIEGNFLPTWKIWQAIIDVLRHPSFVTENMIDSHHFEAKMQIDLMSK